MHLKRFFGRLFAFLAKAASYVFGVISVLALTLGMFALMQWIGEEDARDDRDIGSVILSIPVFVGSMSAYVFWFVPKVGRTSFFTNWVNAPPARRAALRRVTVEDRHRAILRALGAVAVPVVALWLGFLWEFGSRGTSLSGMGMYAAMVASCILCGLYFGIYLRAVNSGRIAISRRPEVQPDPFAVDLEPAPAPHEGEVTIIDPRRDYRFSTKPRRKEPDRANRRRPDGTIDYAFATDDCTEWFL